MDANRWLTIPPAAAFGKRFKDLLTYSQRF
jgi:hypothetical protein